eukprot:CAMPEP_0170392956 /NCGR_PEP_ID=MMETSP0117_2-20130122/20465_1 /TAXON_ID=400756 /ORGANISM="Durinskia baltica, Strain CSIRO CS-38" /LENGTH=278 /DNA_ID=CAMNT_0010649121 /DNA_START=70 /DNA_END=902 /DNA_ORIENTATION=+
MTPPACLRSQLGARAGAPHHEAALADDPSLLHQAEGLFEAIQGVLGSDMGPQLPLIRELQQRLHGLVSKPWLDGELVSHAHTHEGEASDQRHVGRELRDPAGCEPHDQQPRVSTGGNTPCALVKDVAADGLVDDIAELALGDLADGVFQCLLGVVHDEVGADLLASLELLVGARRSDDAGAQGLPELHRHDAHAPAGARDQQPLAGLELAALRERVVARRIPHVEAGTLAEGQRLRQRMAHLFREHGLLARAPAQGRQHGEEHAVAGLELLGPRPDFR